MKTFRTIVLIILTCTLYQITVFSAILSRIQGTVRDQETNEPLKNVIVQLFKVDGNEASLFPSKETRTNDMGDFKIDDLLKGKYIVSCYLDNYITLSPFSEIMTKRYDEAGSNLLIVEVKEGRIQYLKLEMKRGGGLKVDVIKKDESGTSGLSDVRINISAVSNPFQTIINDATDSAGKYSYGGLIPETEYQITINPNIAGIGLPEYEEIFTIEKGKATELRFFYDLTDKTGISGMIKIKNKVVSRGDIYLWRIENKKGKCVFERNFMGRSDFIIINIDPGNYLLYLAVSDEDDKNYMKYNYVTIEKGITKSIEINFE